MSVYPSPLPAPDELISCHGYEPVYFPGYVIERDAVWQACCDALAAELEAYKAEAARYRWLRINEEKFTRIFREYVENCPDVESLDFEIDSAINKATGETP